MKKNITLIFIALISLILVGINVQADDMVNVNIYEESYTLSTAKPIDNVFLNEVAKKTVYDKDVNHSGITIGIEEVEVLSKLKGVHIIYSRDSVNVKGSMDYPVIIAQNVVIEGKITGDMLVYAPSIYIKEDAEIAGDIIAYANNIEIFGNVKGNVIATTNNIKVAGLVGGKLNAKVQTLDLESGNVEGTILIKTNSDMAKLLEKYPDAVVTTIDEVEQNNLKGQIITAVTSIVIFTLAGYLFARKENNIFSKIANNSKNTLARVMLCGIIVLFTIPILVLILLILVLLGLWIVAVPVGLFYIAFIIIACMLAVFVVSVTLYELIKGKFKNIDGENKNIKTLGILLLINTVIYLITLIPTIGEYSSMLLYIISIGLIINYWFKKKNK